MRRALRSRLRVAGRRLASAGLAALLIGVAAACSQPSGGRWVTGYYVGFLADRLPVSEIDWEPLTHIAIGPADVAGDGSLDLTFTHHGDDGPAWGKEAAAQARANDVVPILMLGGAKSADDWRQASTGDARERLVANIVATVDEYGFQGVDFDWEPLTAQDVPRVGDLARDVRAARPDLLLTLPVGAVNTNRPQDTPVDAISSIAGRFDQINVMTYGMHGGWKDWASWHVSALHGESQLTPNSVDSTVSAYLGSGMPAAKLGVGVGFYGACYQGVTAPGQSAPGMEIVAADNDMSYADIMRDYYRPEFARWDDKGRVPYLSSGSPSEGLGPEQCSYISYEDARSVDLKGAYARNQGLGGVIVWNINQGHRADLPEGERDQLLDSVATAFRG